MNPHFFFFFTLVLKRPEAGNTQQKNEKQFLTFFLPIGKPTHVFYFHSRRSSIRVPGSQPCLVFIITIVQSLYAACITDRIAVYQANPQTHYQVKHYASYICMYIIYNIYACVYSVISEGSPSAMSVMPPLQLFPIMPYQSTCDVLYFFQRYSISEVHISVISCQPRTQISDILYNTFSILPYNDQIKGDIKLPVLLQPDAHNKTALVS